MDNQKRDKELYFLKVPDPGFSPERNRSVIDNSIKKFEAKRRAIYKQAIENFAERADAVTSYLKFVQNKPGYALDKYFTREQIKYFNGNDYREKIREGLRIVKNKNKLKRLA